MAYTMIGSPSDVTMLNQGGYNDYLRRLYGMTDAASAGMTGALSRAQQGYQQVAGTAQNYENFARSMMGGNGQGGLFGQMSAATGGFDPNAAYRQFMSEQPGMARAANENVSGALSDVYSTGRAQANAAANQARQSAASELAAAGLLNTGAAIGSMTEATANPIMQMETQLAQTRAQALQQQLASLQGYGAQSINQGYDRATQLGQSALGLGLQGLQGQTAALQAGAAGQGGIGSTLAGLYGQGMGLGAGLNEPQYYNPQYERQPTALDYITGIGGAAASIGSLLGGGGGIGSALGGLLGGRQPSYSSYQQPGWWASGGSQNSGLPGYQNPWATGYRSR